MRVKIWSSRSSAEPQRAETELAGWAYRIRTGESVRELSNWNSLTTSPEVGANRAAETLRFQLQWTDLQVEPRLQQTIFSAENRRGRWSTAPSDDVLCLPSQRESYRMERQHGARLMPRLTQPLLLRRHGTRQRRDQSPQEALRSRCPTALPHRAKDLLRSLSRSSAQHNRPSSRAGGSLQRRLNCVISSTAAPSRRRPPRRLQVRYRQALSVGLAGFLFWG